ncbi:MAG: UPF0182 family protein [Acidobacteria bacterium]|nr:UPF0182 family protein [Acidobacteriota bacterium]
MRKRILMAALVVAVFLILGGLSFAVGMYFDYLWFAELGKTVLFTTALFAKSTLGSGCLLVGFLFVYLNLAYANRGPGVIQLGIPTPTGQITAYTVAAETVRRVSALLGLFVGLLLGVSEAANWEKVWRWLYGVSFEIQDPIFSRDVSFYMFTVPFFREIIKVGLILGFLTLIGVVVLYYFKGVLSWKSIIGSKGGPSRFRIQVSLLAAFIFLLLAASAFLGRYEVLFGSHDVFSGAGYSDLYARVPMQWILAAAALLAALMFLINAFASKNRLAIGAVVLYIAVMFLGNLYPAVIQKLVVDPNEFDKESPQIAHNIEATLQGYGLSRVEERDLSGDVALTARDIHDNRTTIQSIRLWDQEPLLDALKQIQEIRTYYDFVSADNDRYVLDGDVMQFMLSARELNSTSLPERTWINEHLSYTHGYGVAVGPVNTQTEEGLPKLLVKDIPPVASDPVFEVSRPEIYFGELTEGYAIVKTNQKEFDYPSGDTNMYTTYEGTGGVAVSSFFRKLLSAYYFRELNILLSPQLTVESRFLYFRDLRQRVSRLAPFLLFDHDPYLVISKGRLFWIQDGYTVSDRYPYSFATQGIGNYIRNSVKMVMDAYNGTVDMYVADPSDPVIRVYQKIFPGVFRPIADMDPELRRHIRYPEDIFRVQTYIFQDYHMSSPQVFYNKEDQWQVPSIGGSGGESIMSPYYTIMRLPHERQEEFILMLPFTPGRKDNLSAWMVARSDGENYGKLVVYRFPKQKLVYGPRQIVARVNQDAEISRQISLWDQRGSQVIQGNLLIIPIEEALLYVRPLYLRAESGKIPELKRVIVAYENEIAMEQTLEEAIAKIFEGEMSYAVLSGEAAKGGAAAPGTASGSGPGSMVRQLRSAFDRAVEAQRQGNWAGYGEELKKLEAILTEWEKSGDASSEE